MRRFVSDDDCYITALTLNFQTVLKYVQKTIIKCNLRTAIKKKII